MLYNNWVSQLNARVKSASVKSAADEEAISGIKDPNEKGNVAPPAHHDGNDRVAQGLPTNLCNCGEANKEHNLFAVTTPEGVGQGSYPTPVNGVAKDEAATSSTSPLDKIAAKLNASLETLRGTATKQAGQAEFQMPADLAEDADIMRKLASIGVMMIGCDEGAQAVNSVLERRFGQAEAAAIINTARDQVVKQAAAAQEQEDLIEKAASTHAAWFEAFEYPFEKQAYAQGAVDGEQVAQAAAAGEEPTIDGAEGLSDEDVIQVLQSLIESGQVSPEEVEALLAQADTDQSGDYSLEEIAAALEAGLASGEISEEEAAAIVQAIQGGAPAAEAAAAPEAAPLPDETVKAASVIESLFNK